MVIFFWTRKTVSSIFLMFSASYQVCVFDWYEIFTCHYLYLLLSRELEWAFVTPLQKYIHTKLTVVAIRVTCGWPIKAGFEAQLSSHDFIFPRELISGYLHRFSSSISYTSYLGTASKKIWETSKATILRHDQHSALPLSLSCNDH